MESPTEGPMQGSPGFLLAVSHGVFFRRKPCLFPQQGSAWCAYLGDRLVWVHWKDPLEGVTGKGPQENGLLQGHR